MSIPTTPPGYPRGNALELAWRTPGRRPLVGDCRCLHLYSDLSHVRCLPVRKMFDDRVVDRTPETVSPPAMTRRSRTRNPRSSRRKGLESGEGDCTLLRDLGGLRDLRVQCGVRTFTIPRPGPTGVEHLRPSDGIDVTRPSPTENGALPRSGIPPNPPLAGCRASRAGSIPERRRRTSAQRLAYRQPSTNSPRRPPRASKSRRAGEPCATEADGPPPSIPDTAATAPVRLLTSPPRERVCDLRT